MYWMTPRHSRGNHHSPAVAGAFALATASVEIVTASPARAAAGTTQVRFGNSAWRYNVVANNSKEALQLGSVRSATAQFYNTMIVGDHRFANPTAGGTRTQPG